MVTKLSLIIIIHLCCISFIFLPTTSYLLACHVSTYMNSQVTELYADNLEGTFQRRIHPFVTKLVRTRRYRTTFSSCVDTHQGKKNEMIERDDLNEPLNYTLRCCVVFVI